MVDLGTWLKLFKSTIIVLMSKKTTMQDIIEWNSMEKSLDEVSSPISKVKSNKSVYKKNECLTLLIYFIDNVKSSGTIELNPHPR